MNISFGKCLQVINSCETEKQLLVALKYAIRYAKLDNLDVGYCERADAVRWLIQEKNEVICSPQVSYEVSGSAFLHPLR